MCFVLSVSVYGYMCSIYCDYHPCFILVSSLFSTLLSSINCHYNQFLQHQPFVVIHLKSRIARVRLWQLQLPLCAILKKHNIGYHIYADDTQLYISFNSKEPLTSLTKLNNCISDIRVWMIKNKLKFNDSKTECIIFRSPRLKTDFRGVSISVGDSQISSSPKVRDLGVIFDNSLSLDAHISNICRSTHFHLRNIGRIRTLLTFHATAQLIHALITTRLDFCNSILYNLPNNKIGTLQRIQNQAARMLTRSPRRNHITPVLRELHWLRISDRIIFKVLILTHKAFHGVAPVYLCE